MELFSIRIQRTFQLVSTCHKILPKQIIFEQIDVTDKSPSCMQDDIPDKANINSQENKAIMNFQL